MVIYGSNCGSGGGQQSLDWHRIWSVGVPVDFVGILDPCLLGMLPPSLNQQLLKMVKFGLKVVV